MARPLKEGMDYFPHDVDAMSDDKIEILRALHGNDGYVFYFGLLERIYRQPNFEYDISDAETVQILCKKLLINMETFQALLKTSLKYGCFDAAHYQNTGCLTSNGIKKRAESVVKKRETMRGKYNGSISASETREETQAETPQSKGKESKEKEEENKDDSTPPKPPDEEQKIDYDVIKEKFNTICLSLPQVRALSQTRRTAIKARMTDEDAPATLETFVEVFKLVEQSEFLSGRNGKWTSCNFDWILKKSNWLKILEGSYNRESKGGTKQNGKKPNYADVDRYAMGQTWDAVKGL